MNRDKYFDWLCSLVSQDGEPDLYSSLLEKLDDMVFSEETAIFICNDCNRVEDGFSLREKYCNKHKQQAQERIFEEPCSVLEFLIGLAMRTENQFGIKDGYSWFWEFIGNLKLTKFDNDNFSERKVEKIIEGFLQRRYSSNGDGGLFPILYPSRDQRDLEIWYQLNAYLDENYS